METKSKAYRMLQVVKNLRAAEKLLKSAHKELAELEQSTAADDLNDIIGDVRTEAKLLDHVQNTWEEKGV